VEDLRVQPHQNNRRWIWAALAAAIFILILGVAAWWYYVLHDRQSTDDAYVAGNVNPVTSQISGSVVTINHTDTERVRQGDVLVVLDKTDARQALEKAQSSLAYTVRQLRQLALQNAQNEANVRQSSIKYRQASDDFHRQNQLARQGLVAKEALEHARDTMNGSEAALDAATQQYKATQALLLDTPLAEQPQVRQAAEALREAWLTLQRTDIRSPVSGYIAQRDVQVGQTISPGQMLMSVVPENQMWINANFKETQLDAVRIGQPVSVVSDLYGSDVVYRGKVLGVNMGTGGAFSLLPAQNASGNWIKVIQRVPVRISLDPETLRQHPLRIGLSVTATVMLDNNPQQPAGALPTAVVQKPALQSDALVIDTQPADDLIADIIARNGPQP
jgi:multidrug resistance protein A-like membrane protein